MDNVQCSQYSCGSRYSDKEISFSSLLVNEIENEDIDEVKWLLLHKNADPNLVLPDQGVSAMHVLAGLESECFSVDVIQIAIEERGGDPNIRSADGLTPVHLAALWGRCSVLETLLKFGGDPLLLEYKFSLNAEDLALKEHQWQTHAILATFSIFNERYDPLDELLNSSLCKPSRSNESMEGLYEISKTTPAYTCVKSQDINSNGLGETECKRNITNLTPISSKESLKLEGNKPVDEESTKEQDMIQRKKKLSDQFAESFAKFKHFFGRASFPKPSSSNSPKVYSKRKTSKTSI